MDPVILFTLLTILFLLICSAFFSAAETGLTTASRAKIHKLSVEGNKRAKMVEKLRAEKERLIGAILLGNNAINILASAITTHLLTNYFGDGGVMYATVIMTLLVLIFSEVLPKTYALQRAEKVALAVSPIFIVLTKVLYPITRSVQMIVDGIMGIFRINTNAHGDIVSVADALRGAIELHHREGHMRKVAKDMIAGVLDLYEVEVSDIMVHRKQMEMVDIDQSPSDIVNQVLDSNHTRIPLWKDDPDNIIGVLHAKDLLRALKTHTGDIDELDIAGIASSPWFIPETTPVNKQLAEFRKKRRHFALVVDEYGALQGLVTLEDVIEEIVGEILDEHDTVSRNIISQGGGWYYLDGTVNIRDLNRKLDWNLPDDDASTVAGLIIHEAATIPDVGEIFTFYGVIFEIHEKEGNQLTGIRVRKEE